MSETLDIVIRNFYRILRSGAMNEYVSIEPMSPHKWRRLAALVSAEGVADVAARAAKNLQYEDAFNMPLSLRQLLSEEALQQKSQQIRHEMNNPILKKKLDTILITEQRADNGSRETLDAIKIIIANCQQILAKGVSTRLIIRLGNYLRLNAKKIDYAKLALWLRELQLQRMAQLVGSILIMNFDFKKEELPFVKKVDAKAARLMTVGLQRPPSLWQRGAFDYFGYAPMENVSIILKSLKSRLDAIDE